MERSPRATELAGGRPGGGAGANTLRHSVALAVRSHLERLNGQTGTDFYQKVLREVEAPLLEEIMRYTRNNQTRASQMLGLNRGTLRKKLRRHGLLASND